MYLKDKFSLHADWRHYEEIRRQTPQTEINALVETTESIQQWPENVTFSTHFPQENGNHIYSINARSTDDFEKFCSQPIVRRLAF